MHYWYSHTQMTPVHVSFYVKRLAISYETENTLHYLLNMYALCFTHLGGIDLDI